MENVIEFPAKSVRDRVALERAIREGLNDEGLPPNKIDAVIANMSGFLDAICFDFTFRFTNVDPSEINGQMEEFKSLLNSRTNALITERVKMEVLNLVASPL